MKTEINIKEMSDFDSFIRSKYGESVLWNNGEPTHPLYLDLWCSWCASSQREGHKLVPVEPTERMLDSAYSSISDNLHYADLENIYKAMIEAYNN